MEGPPLGPGGEDITWPDQVAPRGRKVSSTRKIKPQTSNPWTPCGFSGAPCGGGGLGIVGSPWGCTMWWAGGAGTGPGLTVTVVEGSHVPGLVRPAVVVVCGGWMTGRLVTGMRTRAWLGSCWVAASAVVVGAGGRGAWVVVGWGSRLG